MLFLHIAFIIPSDTSHLTNFLIFPGAITSLIRLIASKPTHVGANNVSSPRDHKYKIDG